MKRKENSKPRIKLAEYKEGEDIEDFLEMFEGKMKLHEIEKGKWIVYLTELLQGKAREACRGVNYSMTDYDDLKDTLLQYFDVTAESQRRKFRECKWNCRTVPEEYFAQKRKFGTRWLVPENGRQQMLDKVLVEGALEGLPNRMCIWIGEKHPQNLKEMFDLAQTYSAYHGTERNEVESSRRDRPIKQYGLRTDDRDAKSQNKSGYRDLSKITCFKCGNKGHYTANCKEESYHIQEQRPKESRFLRKGTVNGSPKVDKLISEGSIKKDRKSTVGYVGKAIEHALADVGISVEGRKFKVEALVIDGLNIPVLLG